MLSKPDACLIKHMFPAVTNSHNLQQILQSAEQRPERLKAALNIIEHSDNTEEQKIKLLKNLRFYLLDDIHFKQQLLDNVDYSIYQLRHNHCEEE